MIIYVVIEEAYSHTFLSKAFYDKNKAQQYAKEKNKEDKYSWYEVEEIELEE